MMKPYGAWLISKKIVCDEIINTKNFEENFTWEFFFLHVITTNQYASRERVMDYKSGICLKAVVLPTISAFKKGV